MKFICLWFWGWWWLHKMMGGFNPLVKLQIIDSSRTLPFWCLTNVIVFLSPAKWFLLCNIRNCCHKDFLFNAANSWDYLHMWNWASWTPFILYYSVSGNSISPFLKMNFSGIIIQCSWADTVCTCEKEPAFPFICRGSQILPAYQHESLKKPLRTSSGTYSLQELLAELIRRRGHFLHNALVMDASLRLVDFIPPDKLAKVDRAQTQTSSRWVDRSAKCNYLDVSNQTVTRQ